MWLITNAALLIVTNVAGYRHNSTDYVTNICYCYKYCMIWVFAKCYIIQVIYLARENLAHSDLVIIPYMVINIRFITLYGIITGSLHANYSPARYSVYTTVVRISQSSKIVRSWNGIEIWLRNWWVEIGYFCSSNEVVFLSDLFN